MNNHLWFGASVCLILSSCTSSDTSTPTVDLAFAKVQVVLEKSCVHCHGDNRLSTMPSIQNSRALEKLISQGGWIVPGKPEQSRIYQVVTFPDEVPGAMPPTGHAIDRADVQVLREWIATGAKVPTGKVIPFRPQGSLPRSI
ncbi:MAG: hypothetical protein NTV80_18255 [Verrucomicrobia bacterium]|nr:hypothetical protein [Verrucomicrobiota bacterium]